VPVRCPVAVTIYAFTDTSHCTFYSLVAAWRLLSRFTFCLRCCTPAAAFLRHTRRCTTAPALSSPAPHTLAVTTAHSYTPLVAVTLLDCCLTWFLRHLPSAARLRAFTHTTRFYHTLLHTRAASAPHTAVPACIVWFPPSFLCMLMCLHCHWIHVDTWICGSHVFHFVPSLAPFVYLNLPLCCIARTFTFPTLCYYLPLFLLPTHLVATTHLERHTHDHYHYHVHYWLVAVGYTLTYYLAAVTPVGCAKKNFA